MFFSLFSSLFTMPRRKVSFSTITQSQKNTLQRYLVFVFRCFFVCVSSFTMSSCSSCRDQCHQVNDPSLTLMSTLRLSQKTLQIPRVIPQAHQEKKVTFLLQERKSKCTDRVGEAFYTFLHNSTFKLSIIVYKHFFIRYFQYVFINQCEVFNQDGLFLLKIM